MRQYVLRRVLLMLPYSGRELGLDVPRQVQSVRSMGSILHGDLGLSLTSRAPATNEITRRPPITAELAILAVLIAVLMGIPARNRGRGQT